MRLLKNMQFLKKYWPILLVGLILRLILAGISYHPDVKIINYTSFVYLGKWQLDPYVRSSETSETPDDLPMQYLIRLPFEVFTRPLINTQIEPDFFNNTDQLFGNPLLFIHLILIKIPLIVFDLLTGVVLALLFSESLRKKALWVWMLNPFTFWATAMIGQVDIMPTFFLVLAFYLMKKQQSNLTAISLGMGAAMKSFPILIFPFFLFLFPRFSTKIKLTILFLLPLILSIGLYILSPSFRQYALFAPQLDKIFFSVIPLSGGEGIFLTIFGLIALFLLFLIKKRYMQDFLVFSATALIWIFVFTHFHLHWFLWVIPFLIVLFLEKTSLVQKWALSLMGLGISIMLLGFEASLHLRLLAPLIPSAAPVNGLSEILTNEGLYFLRSLGATIFAASGIFLMGQLIYKNENST